MFFKCVFGMFFILDGLDFLDLWPVLLDCFSELWQVVDQFYCMLNILWFHIVVFTMMFDCFSGSFDRKF